MSDDDVEGQISVLQFGTRIVVITIILGLSQLFIGAIIGLNLAIFAKVAPVAFLAHAIPSLLVLMLTPPTRVRSAHRLLLSTNLTVMGMLFILAMLKHLKYMDENIEILSGLATWTLVSLWLSMNYCLGIHLAASVIPSRIDLSLLNPWPWLVVAFRTFSYSISAVLVILVAYTVIASPFKRESLGEVEDIDQQFYLRQQHVRRTFVAQKCREPTWEESQQITKRLRSQLLQELGRPEETIDCDKFGEFCQSRKIRSSVDE